MRLTHLSVVSLLGFLTVVADGPALPIGAAAKDHVLAVRTSSPTYGTSTSTAVAVSVLDFVPPASGLSWDTYAVSQGLYRYQTASPQSDWFHGVFLPNGALIERVEIHACDDSPNGQIVFGMGRSQEPGADSQNLTPVGETGFEGSPGCGLYSVTPFDPNIQADNSHYSYWVFVTWNSDFTVSNRASTIRVYYHLQVSPPPLTATFTDVPTSHQFFQHVEALTAAGITVGCGEGLYCPDEPATRGQVAALLAIALGLHFP
jgi:hypothetical protein